MAKLKTVKVTVTLTSEFKLNPAHYPPGYSEAKMLEMDTGHLKMYPEEAVIGATVDVKMEVVEDDS